MQFRSDGRARARDAEDLPPRRERGWLAEADGGTLFLDEIAALDVSLQVTLLRVLQEREFTRLGDTRPTACEIRVIAASNRDVAQLIQDGTFREDLYYRLCQVTITLPPLRERAEDIPDLVRAFLHEAAPSLPLTVSAGMMRHLLEYPWPGNVRELQNVIQVATALCEGDHIDETAIPAHIGSRAPASGTPVAPVHVGTPAPAVTIALDEQNIYDAALSLRNYEWCIIAKAFQVNAYRADRPHRSWGSHWPRSTSGCARGICSTARSRSTARRLSISAGARSAHTGCRFSRPHTHTPITAPTSQSRRSRSARVIFTRSCGMHGNLLKRREAIHRTSAGRQDRSLPCSVQ